MITLSAGRVERTLFSIIVVLIALGLVAISLSDWPIDNFWLAKGRDSFVRLFVISDEGNVPTWYASAALLLAAALAFIIAAHSDTRDRRLWILIASILAFMSLDESAVIHEMMILPLRHAMPSTRMVCSSTPGSCRAASSPPLSRPTCYHSPGDWHRLCGCG